MTKCEKKECVKRRFCAKLATCQELVDKPLRPLNKSELPSEKVHGFIKLKFSKDLCKLKYKLYVFKVLGCKNENELVTQAHIHGGRASQNGPVVASLFNFAPLTQKGVKANGLLAKGTITNSDISLVQSPNGREFNSVASILDAILEGDLYVNVHGSNVNILQQSFADGILRGQILSEH